MSVLAVKVALDAGRGASAAPSFSLDVAFDVPAGVTVLFGPSGAGKSRTLACIAGLAEPTRGRIALGEEVWFDRRVVVPIHARRVAFVFQSLALFPHMSALDNVAYGVARSVPASERRERARAMLDKMHVGALADRKPRTFSGGEAQRVALARAFAMAPRVVLLDEPFSALDHGVKAELLREVKERIEQLAVPAILVTHQPEDAEILGSRVVFLEHGRVVKIAAMTDAPFAR